MDWKLIVEGESSSWLESWTESSRGWRKAGLNKDTSVLVSSRLMRSAFSRSKRVELTLAYDATKDMVKYVVEDWAEVEELILLSSSS
jgi:hypothetical protein